MTPTRESRQAVFRHIARRSRTDWPTHNSTALYDRTSLGGLESDVRIISTQWFRHDAHNSVEQFVCSLPLTYFRFEAHDQYTSSTRYEMDTLLRLFVLKQLHGWEHETVLAEYLDSYPDFRECLGIGSVPDQSTLWRSWHNRFTPDLRETISTAARTILIKAQNAGVEVPRPPEQKLPQRDMDAEESDPDNQTVLEQAEPVGHCPAGRQPHPDRVGCSPCSAR